jgi:RHS repeat-associated protein
VYDPRLGRWLSRDPAGEFAEASRLFRWAGPNFTRAGGENLFAYVLNDPINYFDRQGLDRTKDPITEPFFSHDDASRSAEAHFGEPEGGADGSGDAYRHCLASCSLAQSFGSAYASFWGWLNEAISPYNAHNEREMDDHNNACGRDYGDDPDADCALECLSAARNGELKTLR